MGLFKKLRRKLRLPALTLRNLGKAAGIAASGGSLGALALSRLASAGVDKRKLRLASEGKLVSAIGPSELALIGKNPKVGLRYTSLGKIGDVKTTAAKKLSAGVLTQRAAPRAIPPEKLKRLYVGWKADDEGMTWENYANFYGRK